ncbi:MAG: ATP-dependent zinc metalloprotease FtsH [Nitriliruptorales bacterium]
MKEPPLSPSRYSQGHLPGEDDSTRREPRPDLPGGAGFGGGPRWQRWIVIAALVLGLGLVFAMISQPPAGETLTYDDFVTKVEAGQVRTVTLHPEGEVQGELRDGTRFDTTIPVVLRQEELTRELRENDVEIKAESGGGDFTGVLIGLLPFVLIIALFIWFFRRAGGQMSQIQNIGRSQAGMIDTERPDTGFDDVAGYEGAKREVNEIIDYLRDPSRYHAAGARGPGGVLLVGPPGTGKTLLARAVAGEADVAFLHASGSEFVEMLVGVGASRVRDLFEKARKRSPSIIFIDELDSVGRKRGSSTTIGSNNEQEQTLNQLLKELDGFEPTEGIVIMAATNRPEMLDRALLRPGRFDRQIAVPLPQQHERLEILKVHSENKDLDLDVDLKAVARGTPGFSGADLENLANEAAIFAVREERTTVRRDDFDRARERLLLGRRQDPDLLRPEELHRVAVHETGHAVVAALLEDADPVEKVTILPTRMALGATEQLPVDERRLHSEGYLYGTLDVRLGGRAAELVVLGEASTGAANDLKGATRLATLMVRDFGLSEELGPIGYSPDGMPKAEGPGEGEQEIGELLRSRPYADGTQQRIDEEVARLLREAEERARDAIESNRDAFDAIVERLLEEETLDGSEIYRELGVPVPEGTAGA